MLTFLLREFLRFLQLFIPRGIYCYTKYLGLFYVCPFWSRDLSKEEQEDGYCYYLQRGDWETEGLSLLWDQCKECGIKTKDIYEVDIGEQV